MHTTNIFQDRNMLLWLNMLRIDKLIWQSNTPYWYSSLFPVPRDKSNFARLAESMPRACCTPQGAFLPPKDTTLREEHGHEGLKPVQVCLYATKASIKPSI